MSFKTETDSVTILINSLTLLVTEEMMHALRYLDFI